MFDTKIITLLIILLISIGVVSAEESTVNMTNGTALFTGYQIPIQTYQNGTSLPIYNKTLHIENGDCVPINSTVDISSLGWGVPHLDWYGVYFDEFSGQNGTPKYEIDMPNTASKLKNFYIDPEIFGNRTGYWYQKYDNDYSEASGNLRMFRVQLTCPAPENKSYVQIDIEQINTSVPQQKSYLLEKKAADILIARGDSILLSNTSGLKWWMFGYASEQQMLDQSDIFGINLDTKNWTLETGNYHLLEINAGNNSIFEEYYNPAYKPEKYSNNTYPALESPFRNGTVKDINGLNPQNVESLLRDMIHSSIDDSVITFNVQYSEPEIQIMRIDALQNPDNETWYNVRGYTNVKNGTPLTITIDQGSYFYKMNKSWSSIAESFNTTDPGVWRQFNTLIPVDYKNMFPGFHYLTVSSPQGATMTVPFYVYKELAPHYIPPEYIEYTGVSPYITPQIITKEVIKEVIKEVPGPIQTITPSEADWDNYIAAQHRVLIGEVIAGAIIIIVLAVICYFGYVIIRSRRKQ